MGRWEDSPEKKASEPGPIVDQPIDITLIRARFIAIETGFVTGILYQVV